MVYSMASSLRYQLPNRFIRSFLCRHQVGLKFHMRSIIPIGNLSFISVCGRFAWQEPSRKLLSKLIAISYWLMRRSFPGLLDIMIWRIRCMVVPCRLTIVVIVVSWIASGEDAPFISCMHACKKSPHIQGRGYEDCVWCYFLCIRHDRVQPPLVNNHTLLHHYWGSIPCRFGNSNLVAILSVTPGENRVSFRRGRWPRPWSRGTVESICFHIINITQRKAQKRNADS